jgi:hypothetical protein
VVGCESGKKYKILLDFLRKRVKVESMVEELEKEGFVRMPWRDSQVAIYCLLAKGEVVYVGKTRSVYQRISQHWRTMVRGKRRWYGPHEITHIQFDEILIRWCNPTQSDKLEREFIHRYKPKHNQLILDPIPSQPIDIYALALRAGVSLKERRRIGE